VSAGETTMGLEAILDSPAILIKVENGNDEVITYLTSTQEVFTELVEIAVTINPEKVAKGANYRKLAFVASEIFAREQRPLINMFFNTETPNGKPPIYTLLSVLNAVPPLDSTVAGYFHKITNAIMSLRMADLLDIVFKHSTIRQSFTNHMHNHQIGDLIAKLIAGRTASHDDIIEDLFEVPTHQATPHCWRMPC
jgi:hypothetical protein